jgi:hypothetical protein
MIIWTSKGILDGYSRILILKTILIYIPFVVYIQCSLWNQGSLSQKHTNNHKSYRNINKPVSKRVVIIKKEIAMEWNDIFTMKNTVQVCCYAIEWNLVSSFRKSGIYITVYNLLPSSPEIWWKWIHLFSWYLSPVLLTSPSTCNTVRLHLIWIPFITPDSSHKQNP